jgi:multiple sugar transport system permease protein
MFPLPIAKSRPAVRVLTKVGLPVALGLWLLPLLAIAYTSLRSSEEIVRGNIWGWPTSLPGLANYVTALTSSPSVQFLVNSLIVTVSAVVGTLVVSSMAGFALAKLPVPGRRLILFIFIAGNLVPFQILMIPVRDVMVNGLGLYDTRIGLILFHVAFQCGFCTFFLRNAIAELPNDLIDAARLDGASDLAILWNIVVPAIRPALAALTVLEFTFIWNDYFWSLVLTQSDTVRPITAGLQSLKGMFLTAWPLLSAAALVAALPPALMFFALQRYFVAGLTYGATRR